MWRCVPSSRHVCSLPSSSSSVCFVSRRWSTLQGASPSVRSLSALSVSHRFVLIYFISVPWFPPIHCNLARLPSKMASGQGSHRLIERPTIFYLYEYFLIYILHWSFSVLLSNVSKTNYAVLSQNKLMDPRGCLNFLWNLLWSEIFGVLLFKRS